jgi:hypothetical protein
VAIVRDADLQPFRNQAKHALVRDTVLEEAQNPAVAHGIKGSVGRLPIAVIFPIR